MAKKKSPKRLLKEELRSKAVEGITHDLTRKAYVRTIRYFEDYIFANYSPKNITDCADLLQNYADYLCEKNYSASTIHTYLASACRATGVSMSSIGHPIRHAANIKRGREALKIKDNYRRDQDISGETFNSRLIGFQRLVGLRRNELKNLTCDCLKYDDKINQHYILVKSGKGGKRQHQYISDDAYGKIKRYFKSGNPNEYVFSEHELKNRCNLHYLRAKHAQEVYNELYNKIKTDPEYEKILLNQIEYAWRKNIDKRTGNPKRMPNFAAMNKYIVLRGDSRKFAVANGLPTRYHRICTEWVSIYCLSHYRTGVAISNYFMVI